MPDALDKLFESTLQVENNETVRNEIRAVKEGKDSVAVPPELLRDDGAEKVSANLFEIVDAMSIPQKIKLALYGNKSSRTILIRDVDRRIPLYVLENPRLTEDEILEIVKNTKLDAMIFREIGNHLRWVRNYAVKLALVSNPKVPADVSLPLVKHLHEKDLRRLIRSKNIPNAVVIHCRKLLEKRSK